MTTRKGIVETPNTSITPFWYRRICEVTLLVSFIILALWLVGLLLNSRPIGSQFIIPANAGIAAAVSVLLSGLSYFFAPKQRLFEMALVSYLFLTATAFLVIYGTGHLSSPFIAIWMLISIFCGLFGAYGLIPLTLLVTGYGAFLFVTNVIVGSQLTIFSLAFGLPIVVSYLIWHRKHLHENEKDRVMSALAQELSQVANKSEIVINAIADGVIAVDSKGIIQLINPAAQTIIGWGKQDALELDYRSVLKLLDSKSQPLNDDTDPIQRCLKTLQTVDTDDLFLETSSGKKLLVSVLVSSTGAAGTGAIIVFRDITLAKAEEREQAEFISTASHEMRTPVAAIEGYLGLALNPQTATIDDKARSYLIKAHESAQHLGRLFQDLLDVSKAEDGRLKSEPTVIDATAFVRDIVSSFEVSAKAKGLILVFRPDTSSIHSSRLSPQVYAMADADHYREIVGNLLENAIKYTKAGDVVVDVSADDTVVTVSVKDTGIGIPAEDIPHLFQKFYRVDNTDTREIGGTGLGLYLCRRLSEAMGGRIWVKSDYGNGSTFMLEMPRVSSEDATIFIEQSQAADMQPQTAITPATATIVSAPPAQQTIIPATQQAPVAPAPTTPQTAPPSPQT